MTSLHHLFELQAARTPAAIAVVFKGLLLTYRELNARADSLAAHLVHHGVGPNILVGLCVHRSLEMIIGILGILKAGGAYVPIDPAYPANRIQFIMADAGAPVLVTQRSLAAGLPESNAQQILLDEPLPAQDPPPDAPPRFSGNNLAYVIYTSGSTGLPKGVQIEHQAVINFLDSMRLEPGLKTDDVVLALTTLSFDIAGLEIFLPLTTGARVIVGPREIAVDGEALMKEIDRHGVTLLQATPTTWRLLLASGWAGSPQLKALCGGEPMPADLAQKLIPRCKELWNMYGPTETTIWSTCARVTDPDRITIGRPIANTETLILDPQLQPVAPGESGELFIGGDGLARGYHNRPELTAQRFSQHPFKTGHRLYRTGDLARLTPEGEIDCLGRLDFQVKINGHRIELGEIESALSGHPELIQAVVTAHDGADGDKRLVAYFVAKPNQKPTPKKLRDFAKGLLPQYMVPVAFVRLENIPLTPNGKVDRKALPAPGDDAIASDGRSNPPTTKTELQLAGIWRKVLGHSSLGRDDKFFDLGGTSLLAVSVFVDIEKQFGRHLPLSTLFTAPTIAELAQVIDQTEPAEKSRSSLIPLQPNGTQPRFFCVHGAGGNVFLYLALVHHLGNNFPFYGLHSQGLDGRTHPLQTIEEMAAHYVSEIKRVQPHGPYCLGGYCMGGTIALEMAQQLKAQGEAVSLVALFDTYNFTRARSTSRLLDVAQRLKFHLLNFIRLSPALMNSYVREKIRIARDGEFANIFSFRSRTKPVHGEPMARSALRTIQAINDRAAQMYQPKPYTGRVTLFSPKVNYAKFPGADMGWDGLILGGLDIVQLPINPHAMLVEPTVQFLAAKLAEKLEDVAAQTTENNPAPQTNGVLVSR